MKHICYWLIPLLQLKYLLVVDFQLNCKLDRITAKHVASNMQAIFS